ncbi:MAG TPA: hypothetical protein VG672_03420 [Bryobacteraceae bacterium]|jgi:hypothetical protein|nr:hypothetical protein [Bryobacteraceae bacterium]
MARGTRKLNPFTMVVVVWLLALMGQNAVMHRGPATLKTWGSLRALAQSSSLSLSGGHRGLAPVPVVAKLSVPAAVASTFPICPSLPVVAHFLPTDASHHLTGGFSSPVSRAPPLQNV